MTEIDNDDRISEVISLSGLDLDDDIDEQSNKFEKPNMGIRSTNRQALINRMQKKKTEKQSKVVIDL